MATNRTNRVSDLSMIGSVQPEVRTGNTIINPARPPLAAPPVPVAKTTQSPVQIKLPEASTDLSASGRYQADLSQAGQIAKDMLKGKESAQISDSRAQENQSYLDLLKSRLGGLDSKEMLASKEQGLAELDQQTAQNLERYSSIAGSNGVNGGARAALMGRALQQSNEGRAALQRQLITDNVAAKDRAAQAYGGALSSATATDMDISKYNAGAKDRDTGLSLSLPFDVMSGIGGYRAQDSADKANAEQVQIAKDALKNLSDSQTQQTPAASGSNVSSILPGGETTSGAAQPSGGRDLSNGVVPGNSLSVEEPDPSSFTSSNEVAGKPLTLAQAKINARDPQEAEQKTKQLYLERFPQSDMGAFENSIAKNPSMIWAWQHGVVSPAYLPENLRAQMQNDVGDAMEQWNASRQPKNTIVCTESHRQGLISDSEYRVTKVYGQHMLTNSQHAAYLVWAAPIVSMMRRSSLFARIVAAVVRHEVKAMRAELVHKRAPVVGAVALACVKALNFIFEKKAKWQTETTTS